MAKPSEEFVSQSVSLYDFCQPADGNYLIRFSYVPDCKTMCYGVALSSPTHAQEGLQNFSTEKQAQSFVDGLGFALHVAKLPYKVLHHVHEKD